MKASVAIYLLCKSIDWFLYNGKEPIRIFFKTLQSNVKIQKQPFEDVLENSFS